MAIEGSRMATMYTRLNRLTSHHQRIELYKLFADSDNQINNTENFWNQAQRHMRKFNGIKQENFLWFLYECERGFNGGNHQELQKQLKYWYKNTNH